MPEAQLRLGSSPEETVVKSNQLIKAKTPFTKLEHRVVAALIAQLEKGQEAFSTQTVSLKDITDLSGVNSTELYRNASSLCDSLAQKSIGVQEEGKDGGRRYRAIPIFNECAYVERKGVIEAEFNNKMGDHLLELTGRYTMYGLPFFLRLSSRYSMRIYEMLKMREGLKELKISVEELREVLGLEDKYQQFSTMKHHVIEKSRAAISDRTDISFTYEVKREGQTPVRVFFYIRSQDEKKQPDDDETIRHRSYDYDRRTERKGVHLDPKKMFKADLSPDELSALTEDQLEKIHTDARSSVQDGSGAVWTATETYRRMKESWSGD